MDSQKVRIKNAIKIARQIEYPFIRNSLMTGDVILHRGKHLRDKFLMLFTPFSHVSLIVRMPFRGMADRVCVIETQFPCAQMRRLSEEILFHGQTFLIRSKLSPDAQRRLRDYLFDIVTAGIPYDIPGLFMTAFKRIPFNKERMYCSALVAEGLNKVGRLAETTVPLPGDFVDLMGEPLVEIIL